jgi:hypothetical protein
MANVSNVSTFYCNQQVELPPEPEIEAALRSKIFKDFLTDFPEVEVVNNRVRDLIYLQWIRFYVKNGKEETEDPQIWTQEKWYRSVMPKIMRAFLQEDSAIFLWRPFKEQMLIFNRLNIFYEKIFLMESDYLNVFMRWNLQAPSSDPGCFPPEVRASITEYIMSTEEGTAQMEQDANRIVKSVISFIKCILNNDSKEQN